MCAQSTSEPDPYSPPPVVSADHPQLPQVSESADRDREIAGHSVRLGQVEAHVGANEVEVNQLRTEIARLQHVIAKGDTVTQELKRDKALLLKDVLIKDVYIAELRALQRAPAAEGRNDEQAKTDHATALAACERLRAELAVVEHALAESRAEIAAYQRTLDLLRYRVADRLNGLVRKLGPVHHSAKSLFRTWFGDRRV